jgi:hypothetical protein
MFRIEATFDLETALLEGEAKLLLIHTLFLTFPLISHNVHGSFYQTLRTLLAERHLLTSLVETRHFNTRTNHWLAVVIYRIRRRRRRRRRQ